LEEKYKAMLLIIYVLMILFWAGPDKKFMTYSRLDPTGPACPQISSFDFELSIDSEGTISYFTYLIQIDGLVLKIGWQAMRLG
jgi:hypothetical protein